MIVPTRNRADRLGTLLDAIQGVTPPAGLSWDIVVVDNGSSDATRAVAEQRGVRCVTEPRAGRSFALNAGVNGTESEFLVFVDDDVRVETQWLAELAGALGAPDTLGAGGRILPEFEGGPPAWLPPGFPFPYRFDRGDTPGETDAVFGANMAFRRSAFTRYGLFRTDLGILPGNPLVGEETEFCSRVVAGGDRIAYAPRAVVHHPVSREQATPRFLRQWHYHYGRSLARREPLPPGTVWWFGAPRYLWREWVEATVGAWVKRGRSERLWARLRARRHAGQITEYRRIFRESVDVGTREAGVSEKGGGAS